MKRKLLSLLLAAAMMLTALPAFAAQEEGELLTVGVSQQQDAAGVQAQIDALPDAQALAAMSLEQQQAVYAQLQAAYDAYTALSGEQKEQLTGTEKFDQLFAVFNGMVNALAANEEVAYRYYDGEWKEGTVTEYTSITSETTSLGPGWYVVTGDVTISQRITATGDVRLILTDGSRLTINGGINLSAGNSLTIYGQEDGSGELIANGTGAWSYNGASAGIGGNGGDDHVAGGSGGDVTVYGGTITATGGISDKDGGGAGIGGGGGGNAGIGGAGGTVTVYDGTITATGGNSQRGGAGGAGIGGGGGGDLRDGGAGGDVTVYGGTVTARGGENTHSYSPKGGGGAGIGGGGGGTTEKGGDGGTVIILSDSVTATGGSGGSDYFPGAEIGGGGGGASRGATGAGILPSGDGAFKVYGDLELDIDLTIPEGTTITIPEGTSLTVSKGTTLINNGTITNNGTLKNEGTVNDNGTIAGDGEVIGIGSVSPDPGEEGGTPGGGSEEGGTPGEGGDTTTGGSGITGGGAADRPAAHNVVNSAAYRKGEYEFWMRVRAQIIAAKSGETVEVNARDNDKMPNSVMQALAAKQGVTLRVRWTGGQEIVIPSASALQEKLRMFYPLSYLAQFDFTKTPAKHISK